MSKLGGPLEAKARIFVIIDVLLRELESREFEELRPPDTLDELTHALVLPGAVYPNLNDIPDGIGNFGPSGWIVLDEGDGQFGEHRLAASV